MPLQNRVRPDGEIVAIPERGGFTGNRGIIHDPETKTLTRRWSNPAWITCLLEFQGRRREVMGGRSWTELFFADEATSFAAGHRPCFYCRRADATRFREAWLEGNATAVKTVREIDRVLHSERLIGRKKRLHPVEGRLVDLPDGTMVQAGEQTILIACRAAHAWSWHGYQPVAVPQSAMLLTPPSTLRAFRAGYRPQIRGL